MGFLFVGLSVLSKFDKKPCCNVSTSFLPVFVGKHVGCIEKTIIACCG